VMAKLPIDPKIAAACDQGMIEFYENNWLDRVADVLAASIEEPAK